jgi:hypothetical protein
VSAHPGLFAASGWAHHPYSLITAPREKDQNSDDATLSGIPRLTRTLDSVFAAYGQTTKLPIWLTEYGYQTDPPDTTIGVSWARQADYLDDATYIAYRNPRIASFAQFLLVDDAPLSQYRPSDPRYWGTFQSGLITLQGKHKPSYGAAKHPVDVIPRRGRAGRSLRIFGQLRTAPDGQRLAATIQFLAKGTKKWRKVKRVTVGNPRGFLETTVKARRSGSYRIVWPGSGRIVTHAVRVRVT